MRKAAILLLFVLFLSMNGAAKLNSTISSSCPSGHEPVMSMANPDASYNNAGTPSMYEHQVCVSGISETRIGNSCRDAPSFYLSSNTTHAHFSQEPGYNLKVCAGRLITRIRDQCRSNQTALFSVSERINGFGRHVAGVDGRNPKIFSKVVCGFNRPPSNVSLSMKFNLSSNDEIYFDGNQRTSEFNYSGIAEFPYIVANSGSHTAGIVGADFLQVNRSLNYRNILTMKKRTEKANFFLPFTEGDHSNIEDDQSIMLNGDFLNQLSPSFSYFIPSETVVRAMLDSELDVKSNLTISSGNYRINIEKTGENEVTIRRE